MIRRGILIGMTVVLPLSVHTASATSDLFNTSAAVINCATVIGTVSIKPALSPMPQSSAFKVNAILGGCSTTGATSGTTTDALNIVSGKISGTLTTPPTSTCGGLFAPTAVTGTLTFSWKTGKGTSGDSQILDFPRTFLTPGTLTRGVLPVGGGNYGNFTAGGTITGAFLGGIPAFFAVTGEDIGNLGTQCGSPAGLKRITLGIGQITL